MRKFWMIAVSLLALSMFSYAQFAEDAAALVENEYGFGARSVSMGNAFTAVADDYSAVYWNPAGLAQIKRMQFYAGLSHLTYENQANFYNSLTSSKENFTKLSAIGMVFPVPTFRGSLVFALGYQRVKDFDNVLRFNGINPVSNGLDFIFENNSGGEDTLAFDRNVQQEESVNQDGQLNNWSFAGAMDISPNVSVGLTLNFWTGSSSYLFDFLQQDVNNAYSVFPGDFDRYSVSQKIIGDYTAFQVKLGALLRPSKNIRFGFNIALPSTFTVVEKFSDTDELVFDNGENVTLINSDGVGREFEYDVSTPFQFSAGLAYTIKNLLLSANASYSDPSQVRFELPDNTSLGSDYDALLDENKRIVDLYEEQLRWGVGGEYRFPDFNTSLRAGYFFEPSPLRNAPADFDRTFYTFGIGTTVDNQFTINFGYIYGSWKNSSSDSFTPGLTEEDITYQKLYVSTGFNF